MKTTSKNLPIILFLIFFNLVFVRFALSDDPPQKEPSKIYRYVGENNVTVFTDDINKIPKKFRSQAKVLEVKEKKVEKPKKKITQAISSATLSDPFVRNSLIFIVVLVLFWLIKLWIKNMILKLIARVAIKIALVGFLYMVAHHWFFAEKESSFFTAVKKSVGQYQKVLPFQKATEGVQSYNKKQEEEKKALDAIEAQKPIDKRGR
ncbi:MAG: hypothetical protein AAB300_01375 [Nitrospirota bacterium]